MRRLTQRLVSTATIESLRDRAGTMSSMLAAPVQTVEVARRTRGHQRTSCGGGYGSIGHGGRVRSCDGGRRTMGATSGQLRRWLRTTETTSVALLRASSPGPLVGTAHAARGGWRSMQTEIA
ncbi:hypothetical protein SETIT_3G218500v2 [Setaria italica]|uniref:Uncharacterized protein n=1 Tax=Setaria italica TaxID=4555 RepID=A0A368QHJ3_SETIT|nr:hypothetical protein SETIT_3G218500v2 [Setaria italica]